jgi:dihydropteroate synthase
MSRQAVQVVRVHDVEESRDAVNVVASIQEWEGAGMEDRRSRIED